MSLAGKTVSLLLSEDGRTVLELAAIGYPEGAYALLAEVSDSEDLGLWIRVLREDGPHDFLLRWEYILGIDVRTRMSGIFGLSSGKDLG